MNRVFKSGLSVGTVLILLGVSAPSWGSMKGKEQPKKATSAKKVRAPQKQELAKKQAPKKKAQAAKAQVLVKAQAPKAQAPAKSQPPKALAPAKSQPPKAQAPAKAQSPKAQLSKVQVPAKSKNPIKAKASAKVPKHKQTKPTNAPPPKKTPQLRRENSQSNVVVSYCSNVSNGLLLHRAVEKDDINKVKAILAQGCPLDEKDDAGRIPLHLAAYRANLEITTLLLGKRSHLAIKNNNGQTPREVVDFHAEHGTEVIQLIAREIRKGLREAAAEGDLEFLRVMMDGSAFSVSQSYDENYQGPLIYAARNGRMEVVRFLVEEKRADVTDRGGNGKSASFYANSNGHSEVAAYLYGKERPILMKRLVHEVERSQFRMSRINSQRKAERRDAIRIQEIEFPQKYRIIQTAGQGSRRGIRSSVEDFANDVNVKNIQGETALHLAAKGGHIKAVAYLVKLGANPLITTKRGKTPKDFAVENGHAEVAEYLERQVQEELPSIYDVLPREKPAAEFCKQVSSENLLQKAIHTDDLPAVKGIFRKGCSIGEQDENGNLPLHLAVQAGDPDVVDYLIIKGTRAHLATKNNKGQTPRDLIDFEAEYGIEVNDVISGALREAFRFAAADGDLDFLKAMYVNPFHLRGQCVDQDRQGPLHYAAKNGRLDVVTYLVEEKNSDVLEGDSHGLTPGFYAMLHGHSDVWTYLDSKERPIREKHWQQDWDSYFAKEDKRAKEREIEKAEREKLRLEKERFPDKYCILYQSGHGSIFGIRSCLSYLQNDLNIQNEEGETALHWAARSGRLQAVIYLMKLGANPNLRTKASKTPCDWAKENGHRDVAEYLLGTFQEKSVLEERFLPTELVKPDVVKDHFPGKLGNGDQFAEVVRRLEKVPGVLDNIRNVLVHEQQGFLYELEDAFQMAEKGTLIEAFGAKYPDERGVYLDFDIQTPTKLIENKAFDWGRMETYKTEAEWKTWFLNHKNTAVRHGSRVWELHSKEQIPAKWRDWFTQNGIPFISSSDK